jgi:tetratricopeptide (TPR) repeat protein
MNKHSARNATLALEVAVCIAYAPSLGNGFLHFDDDQYVVLNPQVQAGLRWEGVHWAFTSVGYAANWHPLPWLSHMSDVSLFGLSPWGHHLVSVLIHALATALFFLALKAMTGSAGASAVAAAFFGLHPLRVESVAWVAERKDVLSGLFWMATLIAWIRYARCRSVASYLLALAAAALALASKPMAVTLPLVLILLDWWPLGRFKLTGGFGPGSGADRRRILPREGWLILAEKIPFLVLSGLVAAVTLQAQRAGGTLGLLDNAPLHHRLANVLASGANYLVKAALPVGLAVFYPFPESGPPIWKTAGAALLLSAATVAAVFKARRHPWFLAGWLWYLLTLLPVIGLVQAGFQAMADRYTYLPLAGIFIAATWAGGEVTKRWPRRATLLAGGVAALILLCAFATVLQIRHWRDDFTLFNHAARVTRGNWMAHYQLAGIYRSQRAWERTAHHYAEATRLKPRFFSARLGYGNALLELGRTDEAVAQLEEAVKLMPAHVKAHNNLGLARLRQGRIDAAIASFRRALELDPGYAEGWKNLGSALALTGRSREAGEAFARAAMLRGGIH